MEAGLGRFTSGLNIPKFSAEMGRENETLLNNESLRAVIFDGFLAQLRTTRNYLFSSLATVKIIDFQLSRAMLLVLMTCGINSWRRTANDVWQTIVASALGRRCSLAFWAGLKPSLIASCLGFGDSVVLRCSFGLLLLMNLLELVFVRLESCLQMTRSFYFYKGLTHNRFWIGSRC